MSSRPNGGAQTAAPKRRRPEVTYPFPPGDLPRSFPPGNFPPVISPDLESLLERMKRLDLSKPVTRRLTPGSNGYINPNACIKPTRPSRHVTWTGRRSPGELPEGNYRGE